MVSVGSYLLGAAELAVVVLALGFSAVRLRARLLPSWSGAPARLVEAIIGVALLIWLSELLGAVELFYAVGPGRLVACRCWGGCLARSGQRGAHRGWRGGGAAERASAARRPPPPRQDPPAGR